MKMPAIEGKGAGLQRGGKLSGKIRSLEAFLPNFK